MDQAALAISAEVLDETRSLRTSLTQMSRDWTGARQVVGVLHFAATALCHKLAEGPKDAPWSAELAAMQKALSLVPESTMPFNADKPSWNDMAYLAAGSDDAHRLAEWNKLMANPAGLARAITDGLAGSEA